ncbi:hypothetical protein DIC66_05170 [Rhodoferax lacus]|uniref:Uncharacterized protein n=1 Tax=Rhodoferax lacus TaxID=2184758 RepID=A0A3E1RFS4_9BURK|nr:hypothetical protein [Rhodoferax lacus]RFO98113.1 hypothetical protein DIC66_05170 [Rhodoferax lacus]
MKGFYFDLVALPRSTYWLRASVLLLGALALACVLAYWQLVQVPALAGQHQRVQTEMTRLGTAPKVAAMNPKDLAQAWQRAHSASVQLGLPWQRFFVQLGKSSIAGKVAFISVEPDTQKGSVVLVAEARTLESMLQFVGDLQASTDFSEVVLQSHAINKDMPEKPVRFRVSAIWRIAE